MRERERESLWLKCHALCQQVSDKGGLGVVQGLQHESALGIRVVIPLPLQSILHFSLPPLVSALAWAFISPPSLSAWLCVSAQQTGMTGSSPILQPLCALVMLSASSKCS